MAVRTLVYQPSGSEWEVLYHRLLSYPVSCAPYLLIAPEAVEGFKSWRQRLYGDKQPLLDRAHYARLDWVLNLNMPAMVFITRSRFLPNVEAEITQVCSYASASLDSSSRLLVVCPMVLSGLAPSMKISSPAQKTSFYYYVWQIW